MGPQISQLRNCMQYIIYHEVDVSGLFLGGARPLCGSILVNDHLS